MANSISWVLLVSSALLAATAYILRREPGVAATHLHFYMHDVYDGPHPTAALVVTGRAPLNAAGEAEATSSSSSSPRRFGDIAVMNNALTEGPERGSARLGTAQGSPCASREQGTVNDLSLYLVFQVGEYAGSSLSVKGRVDTDTGVRESVIIGGTGRFPAREGYAFSRSYDYDLAHGGVVEIDVYVQLLQV